MHLKDPLTLLTAWLLVPGLVVLASAGLGLGVRYLSGVELGALTVPTGFLAGIAIGTAALEVGVGAAAMTAAIAVAAAAAPFGWAVANRDQLRAALSRRARRRRVRDLQPSDAHGVEGGAPPGREGRPLQRMLRWVGELPVPAWAAACGLAAFAIGIAPAVGSGRSVVVGYMLNNDVAVHISLIEAIAEYGPQPVNTAADSFFSTTAALTQGYPLGSYAWPLAGRIASGVETFHLWSPLVAVAAAMLALVGFAVLRSLGAPPPLAAGGALAAGVGYLPYSYLAQGSAKELVLAVAVLGAIALAGRALEGRVTWRALIPAAFATAAAIATFGYAALVWLGLAGLVFLAILVARAARRRSLAELRSVAIYGLVAAPLAVPSIVSSAHFYSESKSDFQQEAEIGNLLGKLPLAETLNIWLDSDYRFATPDKELLTWIGVALAGLLALLGVGWCVARAKPVVPLAVAAAVAAAALIFPRVSIYFEAKTLVVVAPTLALATAAGVLALWRSRRLPRALSAGLGAALIAGVLASDALVYAGGWTTPEGRFEELARINERYAGQGPSLFVDREQYSFYILRDIGPWADWDERQPYRGIRAPYPPDLPHTPEMDDYKLEHLGKFQLLVVRKRPGGSLPPPSFERDFETAHYTVWRRVGQDPRAHLPLGVGTLSGTERLRCNSRQVRQFVERARTSDSPLVVAHGAPRPEVVVPTNQWIGFEHGRLVAPPPLVSHRGGVAARTERLPAGTYRAWVQGQHGPGLRLFVGQSVVGEVRSDLALPSQWNSFGTFMVGGGNVTFTMLPLERPWYLVGSERDDLTGDLVVERVGGETTIERVAPDELGRFCGRHVDWLEIPPA